MQFSFCVSMVAKDPQGIGAEHIAMLKELGYNRIDIPLRQCMALSDNEFDFQVASPLNRQGMRCHAMNDFLPAQLRITGFDVNRDAVMSYARQAFTRAQRIGAKLVVLGSSGARMLPDGFPHQKGTDQLAGILPYLGDLAGSFGITIVLEPLNRLESNILNTLAESVALVRRVGHPHIRQLVDYYHFTIGNEPLESIIQAGELLRHVHFARVLGRGIPKRVDEEGGYQAFADRILAIGYDDVISLEAYATDETTLFDQASRGLRIMREIFSPRQFERSI